MKRTGWTTIILIIILTACYSCKNPLRDVGHDGFAAVTLSLTIPDYFGRAFPAADSTQRAETSARIIDPATSSVDITVSGDDFAAIEQSFHIDTENTIFTGFRQFDCLIQNIPTGEGRVFEVVARDSTGTPLSSGTGSTDLVLNEEYNLELVLLPTEITSVNPGETVTGSVSFGRMEYFTATFSTADTYSINLQSDADTDLYLFNADGTMQNTEAWDSGTPTNETAYFSISEETTLIIGVFGNTAGDNSFTLLATDIDEKTPPEPGAGGVLTLSSIYSTSLVLSWMEAEDNISRQENLEYKVVYSNSSNIESVDDAEENGTAVLNWTANTHAAQADGLTPDTVYYFNILVRDEAGNMAAYTPSTTTTELFEAKDILLPSDGEPGDGFGWSATVSGDGQTAVIGAIYEDDGGTDTGAVYVFTKSGSSWVQTARLKALGAGTGDRVGTSVAVSSDGSTIVASSPDDASVQGAVYVFERGAGWTDGSANQAAKLTASDGAAADVFGWSVSISGNGETIAIGAYGDDNTNGIAAGAVYIFEIGGGWTDGSGNQAAKLLSDGDLNDFFGYSTAISYDGETVAAGAYRALGEYTESGAVYVFEKSEGASPIAWEDGNGEQTAKLTHSEGDTTNHQTGYTVGITSDGSTVVTGRAWTGDGGAAYVYERPGGGWSTYVTGTDFQSATLTPSDAEALNGFRYTAITPDGSKILVGAMGDDEPLNADKGSVCVYFKPGGSWVNATEDEKLFAPDGNTDDHFGISVSTSFNGSTMLCGAYQDSNWPGKAYVFE